MSPPKHRLPQPSATVVNDDQPWIDSRPMFEESYSKFPALADVAEARIKLARKFNRVLPRDVEIELAWREHTRKKK
jgi:hypothetical protein